MLRVIAHKSAGAAIQYYSEGLSREDYYSQQQEIIGNWHGKAAKTLGLSKQVDRKGFASLVENRHPGSGEKLTPRDRSDRIVGYDFNFHSPKSLSVVYALTGDGQIVDAFRDAMAETMREIETAVETRVRKGGVYEDRQTGNLVWAEFIHPTSRSVGGIPDPHLHGHNFVMNLTYDGIEDRWKAAKFRKLKQEAPYYQAVFHSRLANAMRELGYEITRTRGGWEIAGIPRTIIEKFSRRTAQIEKIAKEKGITDDAGKDKLGALTREGKRKGLTDKEVLAAWSVRLSDEDKTAIQDVVRKKNYQEAEPKLVAKEAVDYAIERSFANYSVNRKNRVVAEALRFGVGQVSPEQISREFAKRDLISKVVNGQELCTTPEIIGEEHEIIEFVRTGKNLFRPFRKGDHEFEREYLSEEQRAAVRHILESKDQVVGVRGGAGVGKTTLMKEAVEAIMAETVGAIKDGSGRKVYAFAPSAVASRDTLRKEGFENADTIARLLVDEKMQEEIQGQVLWIDEAGMLGARDMHRIFAVAGNDTRVILTGDSRQHTPVARGDAFRILENFAGLSMAEVTEIRRQESGEYKKAVAALGNGDTTKAFQKLDQLNAIIQVEDDKARYERIASDYVAGLRPKSAPLVVSPTHAENRAVTEAIRGELQQEGRLGKDREFWRLQNSQWGEADKKLSENYRSGMVIQFHQHAKGAKKGERFEVEGAADKNRIRVASGGRAREIGLSESAKFQVFERKPINLGEGERIRITRNGYSDDGRRINNGNDRVITKFAKDGRMILDTGATLSREHGHFDYGYCRTSHSSQSKSVREVLIAQSSKSFVASSQEQFYVSVSRGKERVRIYTDDREALKEAVGISSTRMAAIEFITKEMGAEKWNEYVRSRGQPSNDHSHSQQISLRRKTDSVSRGEINWQEYVNQRKAVAEPGGRFRMPSLPPPPGEKAKGITSPRRTGLRKSVGEKVGVPKAEWEKKEKVRKEAELVKRVRARRTPKAKLAAVKRLTKSRLRKFAAKTKGKVSSSLKKRAEAFRKPGVGAVNKTPLEKNHTNRVKRTVKQASAGKTPPKQVQRKPPIPTRK